MLNKESRRSVRAKRHLRIRQSVAGTAQRPRLAVFRSSKHIYVQMIDDVSGTTIAAASTLDPSVKEGLDNANGATVAAARFVGTAIAEKAKQKGITAVVYDRGGNLYHGRVAALAEAARENGLEF